MGSTSRLHPNMDAQHPEKPHSHASTDRTSSARSQNPRSAQRRAGAPRRAGQQGAGPRAWAQDGGVLQRAGSRLEWELGVDSHLAALNVLERRLGAAGQGRAMGCRGGGARVPGRPLPLHCLWLPILVGTSGVRWSGRMDRQWALCPSAARNLNLIERAQQPVS